MGLIRQTPNFAKKTVGMLLKATLTELNAGSRQRIAKNCHSVGKSKMALALDNLILIDKLCACYEEKFSSEVIDESAAEFMRVIPAVSTDGKVALMAEGQVAQVLQEDFRDHPILWNHVMVSSILM